MNMSETIVYSARKIITMNADIPEATHVAVRDGRILAVGGPECAEPWGGGDLNSQFSDKIILPGFVEGHAHMMAGSIWKYVYCGFFPRTDYRGTTWDGATSIPKILNRLCEAEKKLDIDSSLIGWGFEPIYLRSEQLTRFDLDNISKTRPIVVIHSNLHLMTVNTAVLDIVGYDEFTNVDGVCRSEEGHLTGELKEMAAMFPVMRKLGIDFRALTQNRQAILAYGEVARRVGVTTATDLLATIENDDLNLLKSVTESPDFPLRIVPAISAVGCNPTDLVQRAQYLADQSTHKLRLGAVKIMTDGSLHGYTARLKWPRYLPNNENGMWNIAPQQLKELCKILHKNKIQMHIHVNGDEASEVAINALSDAMDQSSWVEHRHVLHHCQMMTSSQLMRAASLNICANFFSNHLYYFGEEHRRFTLGENRAAAMNACRSALRAGMKISIHSDAPITQMDPLFASWCAVNRRTSEGNILGAAQRIEVWEALHAITLGAAYTLKLDDEIGSIEVGKLADFAVLDEDPLTEDPATLKDIGVTAVVSDGRVFV
jgi:predicted amidohydrolase YtcJ